MPLIQRNLFPSRPPSKKCDGPSVLRAANNTNGNNTTITNPNLTLYTSSNKFKQQSSDSSTTTKSSNSLSYKGSNKNEINNKKDAKKKLKKSQSASMISLLAINNNNNNTNNIVGLGIGGNSRKNHNKINYDSHDSFNSSDASSDPNSLCSSSSSVDMISRRRILSRSRDALNNSTSDDYSSTGFNAPIDEDFWLNKTKLISDHVEEIVTKWDQIDDEIWAKVICMERNRRVAKAYARTPILTINGYDAGFDGHRIGLNGFKNPMRDKKTSDIKNKIEDGIKIRMDENGSLLVKRLSKADVFLLSFDKMDNFTSEKIEPRKSIILFDMKQYHNELLRELKSSSPNLRNLEKKCFCFISFAAVADELLNTPIWCIIINLVALEMLVKLLPSRMSEDNFYSLPITISSKSSNSYFSSPVPPKLPPRDLHNKNPPLTLPEPDYDDDNEHVIAPIRQNPNLDDDPYYYGLSAHVPKFAHPGRQTNLIRLINPPIIRKAMNKKIWNNHNPISNGSFSLPYNSNTTHAGHFRAFNGGIFNGRLNNTCSTFDPMNMMPSTSIRPNNSLDYHHNSSINDNNEIYGVNPTLLCNNTKFHVRSSSSPSLKNIFSRKKTNKDHNNNPRIH